MQEQSFIKATPPEISKDEFWSQACSWASAFSHAMIFDGNGISYPQGAFPKMIMAGCKRLLPIEKGRGFDSLKHDRKKFPTWLCGFLGYDLKNEIEDLQSKNPDFTYFPDLLFFEPKFILREKGADVEIFGSDDPDELIADILRHQRHETETPVLSRLVRSPDRELYLANVDHIRQHIIDGDMYEMNYCIDFGLENVDTDPLLLFKRLCDRSPTPFAVYGRFENHYLISASPERFLRKKGNQLLSQPIKGTVGRGESPEQDDALKKALFHSEKERAENMMIVDLVRNDLAKSCRTGTIKVPELFGIYTFRQLHQMISSVTGELLPEVDPVDAIRNAFPMGSMTGAPKIKVMQLIDQYETGKRGIYSGAAGFFTPGNDFDFNVVIRSMSYNRNTKRLGYWVGSAITYDSDPAAEFRECLLKAHAIMEVLEETGVLKARLFSEKN